jgi:hypothetical protein
VATSFDQIPADTAITCVVGDELNIALAITVGSSNTPVNLTGYTFETRVYVPTFSNPAGALGSGGYTLGATATTPTITPVSLSGGTLNLGLTETQTSSLNPAVGYRWYFRWTDTAGRTLTALAGTFTARIP